MLSTCMKLCIYFFSRNDAYTGYMYWLMFLTDWIQWMCRVMLLAPNTIAAWHIWSSLHMTALNLKLEGMHTRWISVM